MLPDGQARLAARVASVLLQHRRMRQVLRVVRQAHRLALQRGWTAQEIMGLALLPVGLARLALGAVSVLCLRGMRQVLRVVRQGPWLVWQEMWNLPIRLERRKNSALIMASSILRMEIRAPSRLQSRCSLWCCPCPVKSH